MRKNIFFLLLLLIISYAAMAQSDQRPPTATTPLSNSLLWKNQNDTTFREIYMNLGNSGGIARYERIPRYHDLQFKFLSKLDSINNYGYVTHGFLNSKKYYNYLDTGSTLATKYFVQHNPNTFYGNTTFNADVTFNGSNPTTFNNGISIKYPNEFSILNSGNVKKHAFFDPGNGTGTSQLWLKDYRTGDITIFEGGTIKDYNTNKFYLKEGDAPLTGTVYTKSQVDSVKNQILTGNNVYTGNNSYNNISVSSALRASSGGTDSYFGTGSIFVSTPTGNVLNLYAPAVGNPVLDYQIGGKFGFLAWDSLTDYRTVQLPNKSGSIALLSDITNTSYSKTQTDSISSLKTDRSFFQKDTLNSLKNYHFNGYTPVYNPSSVAGISFLSRLNDSTLVSVFRANASGQDAQQGQGVMQMMKYNTRTHIWSSPTTIYTDASGYDVISSGGGGVTDAGRIVVFFRRYNLTSSSNVDVGFIYSDNGGATWSSYTTLTGTSVTSTYGKLTKSGSIYLKPIYTTNKCELVSSTDGANWAYYSTPYNYSSNPADGSMAEPYINKIGTDSLLLVSRSSAGRVWQYLSTDNGLTFNFINKLPLSTAFTTSSAISPEIVYDDVRKNIIVFANYRSVASSASAYTKDKLVVYATPKANLNSPAIINIVNRPDPNGRVFGGYTSTVKLTDSTFYSLVTDYHRPDTTLLNTSSATNIGMWSFNLKYSNYNYLSSVPATKGFAYLNPINGNIEWRDISQPFYINQVTKTISPADQASLELSGSTTGTFLNWLQSKGALRSGNTTGNQWDESQTGNYSLNIGTNNVNGGSNSIVVGVSDTISVGSIRGFAVGSGNKISATGGFVNGVNGKVTAAGASLFKDGNTTIVTNSMANSAEWNYQAGYKFYTDAAKTKGFTVASTGAVSFLQPPVFNGLTGLLKANGSSAATVATAGTDYIAPDAVSSATDASYTITSSFQLVKLPAITAARTVALPAAATNSGRTIKIWNQNSSGTFLWTFSTTVKDATNSTITAIPNQAFTLLESDGTNWIKTN